MRERRVSMKARGAKEKNRPEYEEEEEERRTERRERESMEIAEKIERDVASRQFKRTFVVKEFSHRYR